MVFLRTLVLWHFVARFGRQRHRPMIQIQNTEIIKISFKTFYSHLIMYQISNMKWELNGLFADLPHYFPNVMHTSIETVPTCHNLCNGLLLLRSPQIAYMSVNNTTPLLLPLCLLIRYNCALCTCLTQPSDQVYTSNWFDASHISARVSEYIRCVVMKCWYFLNLLKLHLHAFERHASDSSTYPCIT